MDRAKRFLSTGLVAEKRARMRENSEDAFVFKELDLVRVHHNRGLFSRVLVVDRKPVIAEILFYGVHVPKLAAAITALETFEGQDLNSCYRILCQMARMNSRAMRMMITHSRKFECWMRTSSESME